MDSNEDVQEVLETPEIAEETIEETPEVQADEEKEQLKAQLEELNKKNKQLYERLKKQPTKTETLSQMDVIALAKADVAVEDMDEVVEFAKFKKISVSEALKNSTLKTILSEKNEERRTAQATQTKGSPRGTTKVSGEDLLRKAESTGEIPESVEALKEMHRARLLRRKQ